MLPKLAHAQRFVVDQRQGLGLVVHIAAQAVETQRQEAVGDGVLGQEAAFGYGGAEQAAVVHRQVQRRVAGVDRLEEPLQPLVQRGAVGLVAGREALGCFVLDRAAGLGQLLLELPKAQLAIASLLHHRQQAQAFGVEQEHQPV